jgi:ribosomal protein L7/L12
VIEQLLAEAKGVNPEGATRFPDTFRAWFKEMLDIGMEVEVSYLPERWGVACTMIGWKDGQKITLWLRPNRPPYMSTSEPAGTWLLHLESYREGGKIECIAHLREMLGCSITEGKDICQHGTIATRLSEREARNMQAYMRLAGVQTECVKLNA